MRNNVRAATQMQIIINTAVVAILENETDEEQEKINHRKKPRKPKTKWRHNEALHCIKRDYLGIENDQSTPVMTERQFVSHFRISKDRFLKIREEISQEEIPFYQGNKAGNGSTGASLEARLLLPLKCLAYGVPPHTFQDYFQMSETLARDCCINFDKTIKSLYESEFLRLPTKEDLKSLLKLHKKQHHSNGMFGSLDCCHTHWKNCPKAWQGSFKGKEKKPTIVLEGIVDYHLYFWHASYGYAGTMNDLNILNVSPLLKSFVNGTFNDLEAAVVPYTIADEEFQHCFILVDGIYPPYSRFVRSIPEPIGDEQKTFSAWQEGARKDVERAFGVLQSKFQVLVRPMMQHTLKHIGYKVSTCLILHNMCVSDRVMGDVNSRYDPAFSVSTFVEVVEQPPDLVQVQGIAEPIDVEPINLPNLENGTQVPEFAEGRGGAVNDNIGIMNLPIGALQALTDTQRWNDLTNVEHHNRLILALMKEKSIER